MLLDGTTIHGHILFFFTSGKDRIGTVVQTREIAVHQDNTVSILSGAPAGLVAIPPVLTSQETRWYALQKFDTNASFN